MNRNLSSNCSNKEQKPAMLLHFLTHCGQKLNDIIVNKLHVSLTITFAAL